MDLKDLAGRHMLSGVDRFNEKIKADFGSYFEDCECLSFRLDDKTYTVVEDPSDGYRSYARDEVRVSDHALSNTFPAVAVVALWVEGDMDHVLTLVHAENGQTILRTGTGDWGDYYPYFLAEFDATALGTIAKERP